MAGNDGEHSDSEHTVDDLFQLLVHVRDMRPAVARAEILEHLQLDRLRVDLHIRGGAQKTYPLRQATVEELQAEAPIEAADGVVLDGYHLYETAPPEGITEPIPSDAWGRFFTS
jgi:hypothetical protein